MNYFAHMYRDDYDPNNIKIFIQVVEGVYEIKNHIKARRIGLVNITENKFIKYIKTPYSVINTGENTITLKMRNYNDETHSVEMDKKYTLLSFLLTTGGYTGEYIDKVTSTINTISNNKSIKSNSDCLGEWINF